MPIALSPTSKITIAGMSGCGKTILARHILTSYQRRAIWDAQGEYRDFGSYQPRDYTREEFDKFAKAVWENGNVMFVVEECEEFLTNIGMSKYMHRIANRGRHRGIGYIAITRRIANVNKTVFGLSSDMFLYRQFLPNDLRYLKEFIPERIVDSLPKIADFEYLHYSKGKAVKMKPVPLYSM